MMFAIVDVCSVWMPYLKDTWSAKIDSKLPCPTESGNRDDRYAITHALFNTLKSLRDAVNVFVGINFCRKAVTRNLFSKRKASSKYPK